MANKIEAPKLWELWRTPERVAFDPMKDGYFATDRFAVWDLSKMTLADRRIVPGAQGIYSVGKSRVAPYGTATFNSVRTGHIGEKFAQWAGTERGRVWEDLTLSPWQYRGWRVCASASGPVLLLEEFATLAETYSSLGLLVCHSGKDFPKIKVLWRTEISPERTVETTVGFIQPGPVLSMGSEPAILNLIAQDI
ncbi:hypothetical protein [Glycomyces sp. NPDC048151]|uniref:hypothetical protein n=1 Tax=Glycomyces sp. NPDC048151 TaxID=3364002 RepID=UPI00372408F9